MFDPCCANAHILEFYKQFHYHHIFTWRCHCIKMNLAAWGKYNYRRPA